MKGVEHVSERYIKTDRKNIKEFNKSIKGINDNTGEANKESLADIKHDRAPRYNIKSTEEEPERKSIKKPEESHVSKEQKDVPGVSLSRRNRKDSVASVKRVGRKAASDVKQSGKKAVTKINDAKPDSGDDELAELKELSGVKRVAAATATVLNALLALAITVIKIMINWIAIVIIAAVIICVIVIAVVKYATYDFISDEMSTYRDNIMKIYDEFTAKLDEAKISYDCDVIAVYGHAAEPKIVISVYHTVKQRMSDSDYWEAYFTSNDYDNMKQIFDDITNVTYSTKDTDEGKKLVVNISNETIDDIYSYYSFNPGQIADCERLIQSEELWEVAFGNSELVEYAMASIGQSRELYAAWYPLSGEDSYNTAFIYYKLSELYLYREYARRKTAEEMIADFKDDYKILTGSALIDDIDAGDLIVMSREDGSLAVGIVITADKDYISFVSADYLDSLISIHTVTSDFGHIEGYINIKLMDLPDIYSEGILLWPVSGDTGGNITSYFGPRESPGGIGSTNHKGIDIACPVGTEILACADGTVTDAGYHDAMGNYVVIEHDDGMKTVYMHNYKLIVRTGDKVIKGQVISHSGSTGNSTGPHLHIGVMTDGVYVDPLIYMTEPGN